MLERMKMAWKDAKRQAETKVMASSRVQRVLMGDLGNRELVGAAVSVLIIIIVLMIVVFVGSELDSAADVSGDTHWHNITNNTGELGESAASILKVGVILSVIFAAVGFLIWPYIGGGARR